MGKLIQVKKGPWKSGNLHTRFVDLQFGLVRLAGFYFSIVS